MRYRLNDLLANPYPLEPSYKNRYETLLQYAQSLTPHQAYGMLMLLGKDNGFRFPDLPNTGEMRFPGVNAVDLTTQVGWYYLAGTAHGTDGRDYGILCMFFRYALLPPDTAAHFGLSPLDAQVVDVQLALSVGGGNFYQIDPPLIAGTSGKLRVADKLCLAAGDCMFEAATAASPFPLHVRAGGVDRAGGREVPLAVDLTITSGGRYLLQGLDGAAPLAGGVGTRYYSMPQLVLDPSKSRIEIDGRTIELTGGTFWFDHQWGVGVVPSIAPRHAALQAAANLNPSFAGWDFFVANMDGPHALTLSSIHDANTAPFIGQTGPQPPGVMHARATGKYIDPLGIEFAVSGSIEVNAWRKSGDAPNPAIYSSVPTWVPHRWVLTVIEPVVSDRLRTLTFEPICDDAQALCFALGARYVEAAVTVFDATGTRVGTGYSEAVGYVNPLATQLGLAGLPVTPEMIALFRPPDISNDLRDQSFLYLIGHWGEFQKLMACASMPPGPRPTDCGAPAPAAAAAGTAPPRDEIVRLVSERLGGAF
jgi:predicted secreted hydrolase